MSAPQKCLGLLGAVFGHKFWSLDTRSDHCLRCGFTPEVNR